VKIFVKQIIALAALAAGAAHAAPVAGTVQANGVDYVRFTSTGGAASFNIFAFNFAGGPSGAKTWDSEITLAVDDGSPTGALTGAIVGNNDDSAASGWNDDGSTADLDSFLQLNLAAGNYILGIGAFNLEDPVFRSGIATTPNAASDYQLTYTGVTLANAVPEPTSLALVGLALAIGAGVGRKRRAA
jgi:hypothetical protein